MQFMTRFLISVTTLIMGALLVGLSVLGIVHDKPHNRIAQR